MKYWLMKSEPDVYSIDDLKRDGVTGWDCVRNYQVRNMMRDEMKKGDLAFFYHSNCDEPGIAGVMVVQGRGKPDPTAFDPLSEYHDAKSSPADPRWLMVDVKFRRKLRRIITLVELREHSHLRELPLLRRGNRLSVMPVSREQWEYILSLE